MLRHLILNSIRASKMKFADKYGELVIAMDSQSGYWRREQFPYYKKKRSEARAESSIDWTTIFKYWDVIRDEIKEFLPYKVIQVPGAEADDIIAVLTKKHHSGGVLILANDKDFVQLQKWPNVEQWNPVKKVPIRERDPAKYLQEHIIRGDAGDGVPSILEKDDALIIKTGRRPSITQKRLDNWLSGPPELTMSQEEYRNWKRNNLLINFEEIPKSIVDSINNTYDDHPPVNNSKLFKYFTTRRLRNLMERIHDF